MAREKHAHKDTRNVLMMTAGKLFAEHGYDKVSTRMIADTAGVNLGGIHYHFGSKEKLYIEAFKYAVEKSRSVRFGQASAEFPDLMQTPEGQAELVCIVSERTFADLQDATESAWVHEIILRELYFPSSAEEALAVHVFKPHLEATLDFFHVVNPDYTLADKLFFSSYIGSNALFYFATVRPFHVMYGEPFGPGQYLKNAEKRIAKSLIQMLGLPVPDSL